MNPQDFAAATSAIVVAMATLVGGPTPNAANEFLADLATEIEGIADEITNGPAKQALEATVTFLRSTERRAPLF